MIRVMVFESCEQDIQMFRDLLLEYENVEIVGCYINLEEGFNTLTKEEVKVDIIFTNIEIPVLFGIRLAQYVKHWNTNISVVFTADVILYSIRTFQIRAFDYLIKPFNTGRLYKTIEELKIKIHT